MVDIYSALLDVAFQRVLSGKKCERILFYAARSGDVDKIQKLISLGENPNQGEESWASSPLGIAAYCGHEKAVSALVSGGAKIQPQLENFEKERLWADRIGRRTSYQSAVAATQLLNKYQAGQKL